MRFESSVVTGAGERTANGREAKSEPGTVGMRKGNESERETDGYWPVRRIL